MHKDAAWQLLLAALGRAEMHWHPRPFVSIWSGLILWTKENSATEYNYILDNVCFKLCGSSLGVSNDNAERGQNPAARLQNIK